MINGCTGDNITSATVLADSIVINDNLYYRFTNYEVIDNTLYITHKTTTSGGSPAVVEEWADIEDIAIQNVDRVLFGFIKSPVDNRKTSDEYGVPITYGCKEIIDDIKECLKQLRKEFKLKGVKLQLDDRLFDTDPKTGKKVIKDDLFMTGHSEDGKMFNIFDPAIRDSSYHAKPFYKAKDKPFIPYEENEDLKRYVKSLAKQTVDEYVNLTQHTAFAVFAPDGKSIAPLFESNKGKMAMSLSDTYTKVIDYAVTKAQMGVTDYNSAVRDVVEACAKSGIKTVDYATGYSRRLDTAVRQNVLWGIKQCNQNTADLIGEDFGADGYEISYHSNPRPSHADMGGKQYAIGKERTIKGVHYPSFSEVESLLEDFGCLHFKFSILLGVSEPAYSKEQLAQFKANDNKTFEFEGKKYTGYEATQVQRKLETAIRNQKDLAITAKAAGNDELRQNAQQKINLLTSKYHKFSSAADLPTKMERLNVKGFRSVKVKTKDVESGISKKHIHNTSENKVNLDYIASKEYKSKFYKLPYDNIVCESVYEQTKAIITHRNGTYFEDICLIDSKTGNVLVKSFNNKTENEVKYSVRAERVVAENPQSLIAIHNHGTNNPPTGSDFVSAANRKYMMGVVACHNGDVYVYKVGKKPFSSTTFDKRVDNYMGKGYNEIRAIKTTLDYYSEHYGIEWRQL